MKHLTIRIALIAALILSLPSPSLADDTRPSAPSSSAAAVDQSKPEAVVQAIFDAARTEEFKPLGTLCDPLQQNDGDTDCICAMSPRYKAHQCSQNSMNRVSVEEYVQYFLKGAVKGEARIDGDAAEVDFLFGAEGRNQETMTLVRRDGKWYLSSF